MLIHYLFPHLESLRLTHCTLSLAVHGDSACCPLCGGPSQRVHVRYHRTLADLPVSGRHVLLVVQVRRFRCLAPACPAGSLPSASRTSQPSSHAGATPPLPKRWPTAPAACHSTSASARLGRGGTVSPQMLGGKMPYGNARMARELCAGMPLLRCAGKEEDHRRGRGDALRLRVCADQRPIVGEVQGTSFSGIRPPQVLKMVKAVINARIVAVATLRNIYLTECASPHPEMLRQLRRMPPDCLPLPNARHLAR